MMSDFLSAAGPYVGTLLATLLTLAVFSRVWQSNGAFRLMRGVKVLAGPFQHAKGLGRLAPDEQQLAERQRRLASRSLLAPPRVMAYRLAQQPLSLRMTAALEGLGDDRQAPAL